VGKAADLIHRPEYDARHAELVKDIDELRQIARDTLDHAALVAERVTVLETYTKLVGRAVAWGLGILGTVLGGLLLSLLMRH
jgi:hypothetical protein